MAEGNNIALKNSSAQEGDVQISPRVLEIIASIAAVQVKGVNSMRGSLATSVNELFGRKEFGKGIKLNFDDDKLIVDVYVYLNYGVSVPKVALNIQEQVKQQLLFMTELNLGEVNVHVEGIVPEKTDDKFDSNDLFDDNDSNNKGEQ
ncbi:Asp23/Gls24 family envelope stress response protein [Apilactobacillus micheneri]|uniref:Asp23/Gls24 family envelope stress response protein n=1 Tax=Apilactobacillus micheneri TaxID=1899430 RepID=A0A2S2JL95_9LACO|nr:Asp23/Gls24 family envelope stress response protein [Apilactobacillus micheneri]TPR25503.1 Asp23/Gls24 family envelope stress response protein [Apilactobacillus micheneri]TPR26607.1 Asp23/Gls24 family envelope stress response protein [Apilactobacillus micheneri]TPR28394.1 Asp23/Gls24 family envelope stress response protein [Apilactobacillus micheneri]TPR29081.1 Asp23/Gls24 family envelope stress response protein [Apilactobacillus micheneri]TPR30670.1 Asp23/Gls24 family envelope stress respo